MASVKHAWIKKYGEEIGLKMWEERKKLSATTELSMISKYGIEDGKTKWKDFLNKQKGKGSLKRYIEKYGQEMGLTKYREKNKKLSVSENALKLNGFSEEEILLIKKKHSSKSKITEKLLIEKYGLELGSIKWQNRLVNAKKSSKRSLYYWIDQCNGDLEIAKNKLKEYQSRNKDFYIKKYGEIDGLEKFYNQEKNRLRNIKSSKFQLEVENFICRLGIEFYGSKKEYVVFLKNEDRLVLNKNFIIPDIFIKDKSLIIECYGDFWHGNSILFNDNDIHPIIKKSIHEIKRLDSYRLNCFNKLGYKTMIIWENEWNQIKEDIKQKIKNEIN